MPNGTLSPTQLQSMSSNMKGASTSPAPITLQPQANAPLSTQQLQQLSSGMKNNSPSAPVTDSWASFDKATKNPDKVTPSNFYSQNNVEQTADTADIKGDLSDFGKGVDDDVNNIAADFQKGWNGQTMSPIDALVNGADIAKNASAPIGQAFGLGFKALTDLISNNPEVQKFAASSAVSKGLDASNAIKDSISSATQPAKEAIASWAQAHPKVASLISSIGSIAANVGGIEAAPEITSAIKTGTETLANTATDAIQEAKESVLDSKPTSETGAVLEPEDALIKETGQMTPDIARDNAWKDIQPKDTPTTKLAYAKGGNTTKQGLITNGKLNPSSADNRLLDSYQKLYEDGTIEPSMFPQEKQLAIKQKAAQLNSDQKGFLADHDKAVNLTNKKEKDGLLDILDSTANKSSIPFSRDASAKGAYDSAIDTFKAQLKTGKSAGTVDGATTLLKIDEALTNFDSEMDKFDAWGKTKTGDVADTALARQQAIRDIHEQVRDYIANQLPKNSPWRSIRMEESNMYDVYNRVAQRSAESVGTSIVGQTIKKNPIIKTGIQAAGLGAGIHLIP